MTVADRSAKHLAWIYPELDEEQLTTLAHRVVAAAGCSDASALAPSTLPGADEVMLITYGDTFVSDGQPHLRSLAELWHTHFASVFSTLHVLPFFPSSSDGGFSVVDYRAVAADLGTWDDLRSVIDGGGLMVDLVCNHGSAQSEWFQQFRAGEAPGRDYFRTADPTQDLSSVVRPRTHPLLLPVETDDGTRHVWATFSHDQVDFDFANPDVLVEFCEILGHYVDQGATRIRLDAIAYLWKQVGSPCVHLPQTHEVVKLMRTLMSARDPELLLITETNVPHKRNVSYFGDGDEAQLVYNFTLAPMVVWSLISGTGDALTNWLGALAPLQPGCTFLNFLASHDGLGLRPVEDLIDADELTTLVDAAVEVGGDFSAYSAPGGPRPYELNVSLADLLAGQHGETADRFVVAHALMLAIQGVPAVYVHSMMVSPGDVAAVAETGHKRDINRAQISVDDAHAQLASGWRAETSSALAHLIETRRTQPAFAPDAPQIVHVVAPQVVAIERGSGTDVVFAMHNMSAGPVLVSVPEAFGLHDLITAAAVDREFELAPWQACWLVHAQ